MHITTEMWFIVTSGNIVPVFQGEDGVVVGGLHDNKQKQLDDRGRWREAASGGESDGVYFWDVQIDVKMSQIKNMRLFPLFYEISLRSCGFIYV